MQKETITYLWWDTCLVTTTTVIHSYMNEENWIVTRKNGKMKFWIEKIKNQLNLFIIMDQSSENQREKVKTFFTKIYSLLVIILISIKSIKLYITFGNYLIHKIQGPQINVCIYRARETHDDPTLRFQWNSSNYLCPNDIHTIVTPISLYLKIGFTVCVCLLFSMKIIFTIGSCTNGGLDESWNYGQKY